MKPLAWVILLFLGAVFVVYLLSHDTSGRLGVHTDPQTGKRYKGPYSPEEARLLGIEY